jgi:hypothetical protein
MLIGILNVFWERSRKATWKKWKFEPRRGDQYPPY